MSFHIVVVLNKSLGQDSNWFLLKKMLNIFCKNNFCLVGPQRCIIFQLYTNGFCIKVCQEDFCFHFFSLLSGLEAISYII